MLELTETLGEAIGFLEFSNAIGKLTEMQVGDLLEVNLTLQALDLSQKLALRKF
jgi:hypothetical protein